jgi:hypothetical protein
VKAFGLFARCLAELPSLSNTFRNRLQSAIGLAKRFDMIALTPETEALIQAAAAKTGKTPDQVVHDALVDHKPPSSPTRKIDRKALAELLARFDALPVRDTRTAKEILDEAWGL